MFIVSLVIYLVDILGYINEEYINKFTIFKYLNMALKRIVSKIKKFFRIDNFQNFVSNVSATKIFSVILIIVGYIVSICFSAISFSSGRDIDMKPISIVVTIIIYILTICSIIFINFAVGTKITYQKIPHFLLKASTYTLLILIAISCTDDIIFKTSNIINLATSSIILFIVINILIYMILKKLTLELHSKWEKH